MRNAEGETQKVDVIRKTWLGYHRNYLLTRDERVLYCTHGISTICLRIPNVLSTSPFILNNAWAARNQTWTFISVELFRPEQATFSRKLSLSIIKYTNNLRNICDCVEIYFVANECVLVYKRKKILLASILLFTEEYENFSKTMWEQSNCQVIHIRTEVAKHISAVPFAREATRKKIDGREWEEKKKIRQSRTGRVD